MKDFLDIHDNMPTSVKIARIIRGFWTVVSILFVLAIVGIIVFVLPWLAVTSGLFQANATLGVCVYFLVVALFIGTIWSSFVNYAYDLPDDDVTVDDD